MPVSPPKGDVDEEVEEAADVAATVAVVAAAAAWRRSGGRVRSSSDFDFGISFFFMWYQGLFFSADDEDTAAAELHRPTSPPI